MKEFIRKYFLKTKEYNSVRIIVEFSIILILLLQPVDTIFMYLHRYGPILGKTKCSVLVIMFFLAPFVETLIFQWLLIWIISFFTKKESYKIIISAIIFAHAHYMAGAILFKFIMGILFAWCFIVRKSKSTWIGIRDTFILHSLNNILDAILQKIIYYFFMT